MTFPEESENDAPFEVLEYQSYMRPSGLALATIREKATGRLFVRIRSRYGGNAGDQLSFEIMDELAAMVKRAREGEGK